MYAETTVETKADGTKTHKHWGKINLVLNYIRLSKMASKTSPHINYKLISNFT